MRRHAERDDYRVPEARCRSFLSAFFVGAPTGGDDIEKGVVVARSAIVVITLRVMSRHARREADRVFEA
jgi:hypothetical protein